MAEPSVWFYRRETMFNPVEEGPFNEQQLKQLAKSGKLKLDTAVRSPTNTKNQWVAAGKFKALGVMINQATMEADQQKQLEKQSRELAKAHSQQAQPTQQPSAEESSDKIRKSEERIRTNIQSLLTSGEVVEVVCVQIKPTAIYPDAVVCTNRRLFLYRVSLMGKFSFDDFLWRDLSDAHLDQGMVASNFSAKHVSGRLIEMDWLPKAGAAHVYRYCQEREEQAFHERREMNLEEKRAGATSVQVANMSPNQPQGIQPAMAQPGSPLLPASAPAHDLTARLAQLKQMLDAGLITQHDFDTKKQAILESL